ncbi:hypothetical protein GCM10009678_57270 [Actinomadura kijaniata]
MAVEVEVEVAALVPPGSVGVGPGLASSEVSALNNDIPPTTTSANASATATAAINMRARPLGSDR